MAEKADKAEIVATEGVVGGEPRIMGTRVQVADVVQYYTELGWRIEKIAQELGLDPSQVLTALQYYYQHPQEIRSILRERKQNKSGREPMKA